VRGMGLGLAVKGVWERLMAAREGERKTVTTPLYSSVFSPLRGNAGRAGMPKPTAENLRRLAETPAARRAINIFKNRIASMAWRVEVRPGVTPDGDIPARREAIVRSLQVPNATDGFQVWMEQVIEDVLVGGFGTVEIELTGDERKPVNLYPVDGASIQINPLWSGDPAQPRYEQVTGRLGTDEQTTLLDEELMYIRLNPRTHTVFGLGKMEVAFESITQFLLAHRYAGKLAANGVVQYALWMSDRTPEQQERLIRWWQDEVEGSGRVPVLHSTTKPEVLRFAGGTDADLHLEWQQFLLAMIANAFDLPPMMLGVINDVNRSTAQELADEAFQNAVVPLAKLIAGHITRDVIAKRMGWDDLQFVWSDLENRDEAADLTMQLQQLAAGVLTVNEVREMRGLAALPRGLAVAVGEADSQGE
jgi:HK97 family phage portal protein